MVLLLDLENISNGMLSEPEDTVLQLYTGQRPGSCAEPAHAEPIYKTCLYLLNITLAGFVKFIEGVPTTRTAYGNF